MRIKISLIFFLLLNYSVSFAESYIKASNGITWDKNNMTYSAEGDVEFQNDEIKAYANKIKAFYNIENEKEVFEIVNLDTDVKIYYNDEIFSSNSATYNKLSSLITLYGDVSIVSPKRYLSGDELIVDLQNNTRTLKTIEEDSLAEAFIKDE
ncbi:MAG: hypothetical protein O3C61_00420 [Proteobacteria bacterium]|nr:hypothetical protein [Pseudomonadota bacterium]